MRRECLEQVGELDERFFIYDEDVDWCLRARRAGWKVRFWPGAAMVHAGASSHMRDKTFVHFRSHLSYIRKNHSLGAAACYYAAMALRLTGATAQQALRFTLAGRASAICASVAAARCSSSYCVQAGTGVDPLPHSILTECMDKLLTGTAPGHDG